MRASSKTQEKQKMQPQTPFDPLNSPPEPQPTQPQPIQPQPQNVAPIGSQPQATPVPPTGLIDQGKSLSIGGIIASIFIPLVGIPLSIYGMMLSKRSGYSGKLGKVGIVVGVISTILSIVAFVVIPLLFATVATNTLVESAKNEFDRSELSSLSSDTTTKEAFGVRFGMSKTDVEKVLGQPEKLTGGPGECSKLPAATASALGYDTTCYYNVSPATASSTIASTTVSYKDDKLVNATKVDTDGTITTISESGVNTVKL